MKALVIMTFGLVGCMAGAPNDPAGDDDGNTGSDMGSNGGSDQAACALPATSPDAGSLAATAAQRCNQSGTQGTKHWYRLVAALPAGAMDFIQVELWDGSGAFTGGAVHTGTFPISGMETDYNTCGVCVRGIGHKGAADVQEYFAASGTVTVTSVGAGGTTFAASVSNIGFVQIDQTMHKAVSGGCSANVAGAQISGTVVDLGGTGNGGGGGGGGGSGAGQCPQGVGD